jgi:elongation factor G
VIDSSRRRRIGRRSRGPTGEQGDGDPRPSPKEPFSALVFKTPTDPHVGKLTLFRVFSGSITGNSQVYNPARETRERGVRWRCSRAGSTRRVASLGPGEIGVVLKLKETLTGDTLCAENADDPAADPVRRARHLVRPPAEGEGRRGQDLERAARLAEEDPTLRYHYDPETKQLLISGVGQLHIEVTLERMKRKFNAEVVLCLRGSPTRRP